jgi:hypothetical protein
VTRAALPFQLPAVSAFVPNVGQAPAPILYCAAVPGGALNLTHDAIVLDRRTKLSRPGTGDDTVHRTGRAIFLRFSPANPQAAVDGEQPGEPRLNFLMGNVPARWHVDVPVFARATCRGLWRGIDLSRGRARGSRARSSREPAPISIRHASS